MKSITWTRPHLTYFGKVAVLPGTHLVEDDVAKEIQAHWSAERAIKAKLLVIENVSKAEAKVASTKPAPSGTVAQVVAAIADMDDMAELRALFESDERKGVRDAVRTRMKALDAANAG